MTSKFIIYGLTDPNTEQLRYIGLSTTGIARIKEHKKKGLLKAHTHKNHWINSLIFKGQTYDYIILEEHEDSNNLFESEMFWIEYYKSLGCNLTNSTKGGEGTLGWKPTDITKKKMSDKAKERDYSNFVPHNKKENIFINEIEYRQCGLCKQLQNINNYFWDKNKDRWQSSCKSCINKTTKQWKYKQPKLSQEEYNQSRTNGAKAGGQAIANNIEARKNISKKLSKAIVGTNILTKETIYFPSAIKAKDSGFNNTNIWKSIKYNKPYKGYMWAYQCK